MSCIYSLDKNKGDYAVQCVWLFVVSASVRCSHPPAAGKGRGKLLCLETAKMNKDPCFFLFKPTQLRVLIRNSKKHYHQ